MDNEVFQKLVLEQFEKVFGELGFVRDDLGSVKDYISSVKNDLDFVRGDLASVKNDVKSVKNSRQKLELLVENEIIDKIEALIDGYVTHGETLARVEDALNDVVTNVRYLVARVAHLEKMSR